MGKAVIIYGSTHHGSTCKVVQAIAEKYEVELVDAVAVSEKNLEAYDVIGFASGIDFAKFYPAVEEFAKKNLPEGKKVFFLYTCAMIRAGYTNSITEICKSKNAEILGEYGCKGYNTYGPWKIIGGMNKSHPTQEEKEAAVQFVESLHVVEKKSLSEI